MKKQNQQNENKQDQAQLAPLSNNEEELSISNNDTNFIFNGGEEITEFEQQRKLYSENRPAE